MALIVPLSSISDPQRLQELDSLNLLDSAPEEAFDRLTRLASRIFKAPVALVSLVDRDRQFFKSQIGLQEPWASQRETPLSHSFCQHAVESRQPLIIEDARQHPLVMENLAIRDLGVIAYAGIPMITSNDHALGSFCVIDSQPRVWTSEEIDILKDLAASVMTEVELRRENVLHKRTASYLAIQHTVSDVLLSNPPGETAVNQICQIIGQNLGWDVVEVSTVTQDETLLRYGGGWYYDHARSFADDTSPLTFRRGEGLAGRIWAEASPIWIEDITRDPHFIMPETAVKVNLVSGFGVPLSSPDGIVGVLCCFSTTRTPPDAQMIDVMRAVGSQLGQFLYRQKTEAQLLQEFEFRASLHQIALDLFNRRDKTDVLQAIVEDAAAFLDAPYGELMLKESDELMRVHAYTQNMPFLEDDRVTRETAKVSWKAHDLGEPVIIDDYLAYNAHRSVYDSINLKAVADFPIMLGGKCCGVLGLGRSVSNHPFTPEQIQKGILFSQLAAIVIDNIDLYTSALYEINERKQIEDALRESKRIIERVFNMAPGAIYLRDTTNQRMILSNIQTAELLEVPEEEVAGLNDEALLSRIHPDDLPRSLENYTALFLSPMGQTSDIEYRILKRDGSWRWINNRTSIFTRDEEKGHVEFLVIAQDITERKLAEEALKRYVDQLTTLHKVDAEVGSTLRIHHVLETALNVAVQQSKAEHSFIGLLEKQEDNYILEVARATGTYQEGTRFPVTRGLISRALDARSPILVRDVSHDADYLPYVEDTQAEICIPLIVRGQLIGLINLETSRPDDFTTEVYDFLNLMTARIAAAVENARLYQVSQNQLAELQRLYERVSGLEQLKTDMIRIAAHDLRNPLGIMQGYLEVLKDDLGAQLNEQQSGFITQIERSMQRMISITMDILSLQRIEAAAEEAVVEKFDFLAMAHLVLQEYTAQFNQKKQTLHTELPSQPVMVMCDKPQLWEAVSNLIGNAIKYTPEGGTITVRLTVDAEVMRFEVEDTGVGIPENMQAKLFQPFYRAKTRETSNIAGTGLGLHLVKNIVERHKGSMFFSSAYHKGSTFGFRLPIAPA